MSGFISAVLRSVTWRAVVFTQALGLLFAITPWLERLGKRGPGYLGFQLVEQLPAALFLMLAALAGDEAVRRGWSVWRAFATVLLCASLANALTRVGLDAALGIVDPYYGPDWFKRLLFTFFNLGCTWGMLLLVYLNRQSARRILAGVRAGELAHLQAERRLIASRLAAAQTEVDPAVVRQQLARIRDLYAAGSADADPALERLIAELRQSAARGIAAAEGAS